VFHGENSTSARWLARAACLCIFLGAAQPFYFRMLGPRDAFANWVTQLPYRRTPGLRAFIDGVRARTHDRDRIAIVTPFTKWNGGYAYAFTRSTYLLAPRTTIPIVGEDERSLIANLEKA